MMEPYAVSKEDSKISNLLTLNYANQDFWGFKSRMIEYLKQNYSKTFNDFSESSFVIMLAELWAFLADTLSFKIDQLSNELFIDTVTEPENALRLAKLVGFKPTPPIPAKAMFVGMLTHPLNQDLRISTPVRVSYEIHGHGTKVIELFPADPQNNPLFTQEIIIPAGSLSTNSVVGVEGYTRSMHINGNGTPYQTFTLGAHNVLLNSINVIVDNVLWKEVDYFTPDAHLEYIVQYNANYNATIVFGDGISGKIPLNGSNITINYRQGGGTAGNITTGSIETTVRVSVNGIPYPVVVNFKNYTKGEHGYDGDTIEDIRRKLPLYVRTQDRAVTAQDYKSIAELFSSPYDGAIGKAMVALRNHGCAGNIIDLYVLARNKNSLVKPSDNLKEKLTAEIDRKKMLTDHVCIRSGEILYVDITVDVVVSTIYRKNESMLRDKINKRMYGLFSMQNLEFGKALKEADLIRSLTDIREIDSIDITMTTVKSLESGEGRVNIVPAKFNEIIHPDNLIVYFSYK